MNRRTLLAAGAALLAPAPGRAQTDPLTDSLEALRTSAGVPALGGAIVTVDGLAWSGVTGTRRRDGPDPVTLADRWHLGSNTKAMTAALYARLVETGAASWDATVPELFPDLDVDPAWSAVTIVQLLGHRSGLLDASVMPGWMLSAWSGQDRQVLRTLLARTALGAPMAGTAGDFSYSNAGYILAGAAIERLTGEPWETRMQRDLFDRLGMGSAGFGPPQGASPWGHASAALSPRDPQALGADNPPPFGPAGTVHAAMDDYAIFLRQFLSEGDGWLSASSRERLTGPVEGPGEPYALGWSVLRNRAWAGGGPALVHDGSNTMWLARAIVAPARGVAAICVANAADAARPAIDGLTRALIERFPAG